MEKIKLTDPFIRHYPAPKKRTEVYDSHTSGLAIRITTKGTKSFVYRYRFGEKVRRYTIGRFPKTSLATARDKAGELAYMINHGTDPLEEKKRRKHKATQLTFKAVADEFVSKYLPTLKERTATEYKRHIEVYLKPLHSLPINEVTKHDILSILDKKAYRDDAPVMANRIRATLSSLYTFALKRGIAKQNIIESVSKYATGNTKRDRFYSEKEIQILWEWFGSLNDPIGQVYKMLLITGQRKTETMRIKWSDITGNVWTIPAELAKNGQSHDIPLPDMAMEIIEDLREYSGHTDYVFASPRIDGQPLDSIKAAKEKIQDQSEIADFRPHDLRRTVATYMAKLGVERTVLGKVLNHRGLAGDSQVTAIYDRHSYMDEKRTALNRWSHKLGQIIEGTEAKITKIG